MPANIAIRLNVEGGAELRRTLDETGTTGQAAFQKVGAAADQAGAATDRQTARYQKMAAAAREAEAQARAQANVNALLGVTTPTPGAARASAGAFEAELTRQDQILAARQERMEALSQSRINALLGVRDGQAGAARASASAFEDSFRREAETRAETTRIIADRQGAQARATDFRTALDQRLGVRADFAGLGRGEDIAAYGSELDRVRARWVPLAAASQAYKRDLVEIAQAAKTGALNETERADAVRQTKTAFVEQVREIRAAGPSGPGRRLRNDEVTNLMYQGGDVAAQLGSGTSLSMIAMQQGPQIAQIFAGPGGASIKGAASQAGEAVAGFVARIGLVGGAIGGLTLAAGVSAAAMASYRSGQTELDRTLAGVGRTSGATTTQINALADAQARAGGMSRGTAREVAATYATTGRVDASLLGSAVGATTGFSRFLNVDQKEGAEQLAGALSDVSRGAGELASRYGLLSDAQAESIRRMDAQGDRLGAQKALLAAVTENTRGLAEETRGWSRITDGIANLWDRLGASVSKGLFGGTLDQELAKAQERLSQIRNTGSRPLTFSDFINAAEGGGPDLSTDEKAARESVDRLQKLVDARNSIIESAQRAQRSAEVGGIVRALLPEQQELQRLQDKVDLVRKAIADPVKFGLDARQLQDATFAFERISRIYKAMADDVERFGSASVAAANRTAEFGLRTATMNPVDRAAAEIRKKFDDDVRTKALDPNGRSSTSIEAEYEWRSRSTTDVFERGRLDDERKRLLRDAREMDGLRRERDLRLEELRQRSEQSATRSSRLPDGIVEAIRGAESRGNDYARNPLSTATGGGQFIEDTWLRLFKDRFAERAAGMSRDDILSRRTNRGDTDALIEAYAQENARALERAQMPVNSTNLYLGHHFGEGGMLALLRADPGARARDILGEKVAAANPRTVGDQTVGGTIGTVRGMIARNDPGIRASRDEVEVIRSQIGATDQSAASAARLQRVQELLNGERQKGTDLGRAFVTAQDLITASSEKLTPEMAAQRKAILETADAYGRASAASMDYRGRSTLMFERDQLGRSSTEASVFARTRSVYGETSSRDAQTFMAQARENANLYETKSMLTDGVTSFVTDLRRGGDAATALTNAFGSAADRLLSKAIDSAISSALGSGTGGAGFLASLFGGGGGNATGMTLYASPAGPGFSGGGWTGAGGRYDVAGFVHRGEVVFSQDDVARHGGVGAVEAMRRSGGLRGYAEGGIVDREAFTVPRRGAFGPAASAPPAITFITPPGMALEPDGPPQRRADGGYDQVLRTVESGLGQRMARGQGPFKGMPGGAAYRQG